MEVMDRRDNRQTPRESLFLLADLRVDGLDGQFRIKVRNLSELGMMGEGPVRVMRGTGVEVNLANLGWTAGTIAWVQDTRFGVAFAEPVDVARAKAEPEAN